MYTFQKAFVALLVAGLAGCAAVPSVERSGPPDLAPPLATGAPLRRSPLTEPPGAFFADVTQATIGTTICMAGWTATVRPSTSFTNGLKLIMLRRAGLPESDAPNYELDHFVPLALGGHPRSEDNLWLQRWDGPWNARVKDQLERRLQVLVCAGTIGLRSARAAVQHDWHAAYEKFVAGTAVLSPDMDDGEAPID